MRSNNCQKTSFTLESVVSVLTGRLPAAICHSEREPIASVHIAPILFPFEPSSMDASISSKQHAIY